MIGRFTFRIRSKGINALLPTADIAAARGVDPKKFSAFQKQNPSSVKESSELTAMLTIARLR